jgi:hypothetical protein
MVCSAITFGAGNLNILFITAEIVLPDIVLEQMVKDGSFRREDIFKVLPSLFQLRNLLHHRRPTGLTDRLILHSFALIIDMSKLLGDTEQGEYFLNKMEQFIEKVHRSHKKRDRHASEHRTSRDMESPAPPRKKRQHSSG